MNQGLFNPVQIQSDIANTYGLYKEYKPSENLRKYIYCYWISPSPGNSMSNHKELERPELVIPDGCVDVLLGADKNGHSCHAIIVGTMSKAATVNMEHNNIQTFGIRFYPGGLQAFIKENAYEFTDKMESIYDVGLDVFVNFFKELSKIKDIYSKISFANRYFTLKMKDNISNEDKFQNMIYHIYNSKGTILVNDIAQQVTISERQMARIFYNRVGVSTKTFIKIVRFQSVLKLINMKRDVKIVDAAVEAGYYDQSHFTRDFYDLSSINPSEYLRSIIKK